MKPVKEAIPSWLKDVTDQARYFRKMELEHKRLMASIKQFTQPFEEARKAAQQIAEMHKQSMASVAGLNSIRQIGELLKFDNFTFGMPMEARVAPAVQFDIDLARFRRPVDTAEEKRLEKVKNKRPIGFIPHPRRIDR
jgi:hypothetical protein